MKKLKKEKRINKLIIVLMVFIFLSWVSLIIGETFAYFINREYSAANFCYAGTLDFCLISAGDFSPSVFNMGQFAIRNITVKNQGSLDFQYNVQTLKISGDDNLCNALHLEAKLEGEVKYSGSLMGCNFIPPITINRDGKDDWIFKVSLPASAPNSLQQKNCKFKFIFNGWQTNIAVSALGFSDTEEIINDLTLGAWEPEVEVIYPNGGEVWYVVPLGWAVPGLGKYEIVWQAFSPIYPPEQLDIDIWFCKESGNNCFYKITESGPTENDGELWWTIPYDPRFIGNDVRIKVVAKDPDNWVGQDMSDNDFCPPMLTETEALAMLDFIETASPNNQSAFLPEPQVINFNALDIPIIETASPNIQNSIK